MEFFRFCLEIIQREAARLNVGIKMTTVSQLTAATVDDVNYDDGHNRCAFLYRCGTINLSLATDCFSKFLSDYNGIEYLMAKWKFDSHLTFCSISKGPALDYIALLLSHEQCKILTSLIGNIKIIAKHGAWRNTANIVQKIINKGYFKNLPPSVGNIEVIQGDPLYNFTQKVKLPINESDVVMMIRTLNLTSSGYDQEKISKAIQDILDAVKPGAVLFCIDTKPSVKEIIQLLTMFPGKFLLEPISVSTRINLEYTDLYKAHFGCIPIVSGRGSFFVWEKSLVSSLKMKSKLNEISEPVKHISTITNQIACDKVVATIPVSDQFKKKSSDISLSSLKSELDAISNDMCMQTEPEEFLKGAEVNKITELTNKITDLTVEITKLLENNTSKHCVSDNCFRNSEEICNPYDLNIHKQDCRECCCCQKYPQQQSFLSSSHNSSNASVCDEASNPSNPSNSAESKFLAENTSPPVAQLVIPLTNLSSDTVSQIMSLIAQSNQK